MKIPLSKRLQTCCSFIKDGERVADIGCDHGYLGIYLLYHNIARSVIAADVNQMPLDSAVRNADRFGVQEKIEFFLSDGACSIPRDFDVMVCAGMGADTIISILEASKWLCSKQYRLVLQCQSKRQTLRKYLSENGWHISNEAVLQDGKFLYTVMCVDYDPQAPRLTDAQTYFPPAMLVEPTPHTRQYHEQVLFRLERAIKNAAEQADPAFRQALEELRGLSW